MTENKRTEISTLGEFGLINHLTQDLTARNDSTIKGVGDDCAVLNYKKKVLVTSDLLTEGVHFDLIYTPLKHLGYKAAMVNFSDVYAMNGFPRQLIVSIALSKRFCVEDLEQLYEGLKLACEEHGVDLVGGDTSSSLTGLTLSLTCLGEAEEGRIVYRSGAKDTDLICVSGDLGAAYMGLQVLEREKAVYEQQVREHKTQVAFQPDFAGKEYLLERQLKPQARRDIVELLQQADILPTSMIDVSDGLSSELLHICKQSHVGCQVYEERIPLDYQTASMAEHFNMNVSTCALNGGDDYELLFTVSLSDYEKVKDIPQIRIIGRIQKEEYGCQLVTRDGNEFELKAQGWNPLQ